MYAYVAKVLCFQGQVVLSVFPGWFFYCDSIVILSHTSEVFGMQLVGVGRHFPTETSKAAEHFYHPLPLFPRFIVAVRRLFKTTRV